MRGDTFARKHTGALFATGENADMRIIVATQPFSADCSGERKIDAPARTGSRLPPETLPGCRGGRGACTRVGRGSLLRRLSLRPGSSSSSSSTSTAAASGGGAGIRVDDPADGQHRTRRHAAAVRGGVRRQRESVGGGADLMVVERCRHRDGGRLGARTRHRRGDVHDHGGRRRGAGYVRNHGGERGPRGAGGALRSHRWPGLGQRRELVDRRPSAGLVRGGDGWFRAGRVTRPLRQAGQ